MSNAAARLADFAVGPSRSDARHWRWTATAAVIDVFCYAPPPDPEPGHRWRGYAIYPSDVLDKLWRDRSDAVLAGSLALLGIEVGNG